MSQPPNPNKIYVLLMCSNSIFSKIIRLFTKAKYTHASISFDRQCSIMYSFARKYNYVALPGTFVTEHLTEGFMGRSHNAPCALLSFEVDDKLKDKIKTSVEDMYANKQNYKYNSIGIITCFFKYDFKRKNKFFCSQFVADTLMKNKVIDLGKPATLCSPVDFFNHKDAKVEYNGTIGGLAEQIRLAEQTKAEKTRLAKIPNRTPINKPVLKEM